MSALAEGPLTHSSDEKLATHSAADTQARGPTCGPSHSLPRIALGLVLASLLIACALGTLLPVPLLEKVTMEDGPIENATVFLFMVAIGAVWVARNPAFDRRAAAAATVILACCIAREVSLRRWLFAAAGDDFCCTQALVGLILTVFVALLLVSIAWLGIRYRAPLIAAARQRTPVAQILLLLLATLVVSQVFDQLSKWVSALGGTAGIRVQLLAKAIEEILETMLPVLVILAAWQARIRNPGAGSRRGPD